MDLFRKSALQKMLSPEQLDQLIRITSPKDWIALIALCALLLCLVFWGIWGRVTIDVAGSGIVIRPHGYQIIQSPVEGMIAKLYPLKTGDTIQTGQVIAEISQPLLKIKIDSTKTYLSELDMRLKDAEQKKSNTVEDLKLKITETKMDLDTLQNDLIISSKVVSPFTGKFLMFRTNEGAYLNRGDSILSLEDVTTELTVLIFLPPDATDIENIKLGTLVKIFPGGEKNNQSGYLIGQVQEVSKFPASPQVMMALLNNEQLVNFFSKSGPPYVIQVNLIPDKRFTSGYRWSSLSAKKMLLDSGTLCAALIQIASEPPINLVFPGLRQS